MELITIYQIIASAILLFIVGFTLYYRYRIKIFRKLAFYDIKRVDTLLIKNHFPFYHSLSPILREFYLLEIGTLLKTLNITDEKGQEITRAKRILLVASLARLTFGMKNPLVSIPQHWEISYSRLQDNDGQNSTWKWTSNNSIVLPMSSLKKDIDAFNIKNGLLFAITVDIMFQEDRRKNIFHFHKIINTSDIIKARNILNWITNPQKDHFEKKCFSKYFKDADALRNNYPILYKQIDNTFHSGIIA